MELTDKEKDLIETIRNYKRAYPNGKEMFEFYILALIYELLEQDD